MILIADSGSTKVHWLLRAANGQSSDFRTDGINPVFQSFEDIHHIVSDQLLPQLGQFLWIGPITHIYFYGAGCTPEKKIVVKQVLETVFRKAEEVQVESDMLGAARGLLQHQRGVACILGTGSGSCLYDGKNIDWCVPSLGFILGDEGSAATLGKRLVGDVLKNQLGEDLKQRFLSQYELSMADIIERVYRQPMPNRFLASLARFCAENLEDDRIYRLVYDHFDAFIKRNIVQYFVEDSTSMPVGFVGSVAYFYRPVLEQVMQDNALTIGSIMQDPIEGLKHYHSPHI